MHSRLFQKSLFVFASILCELSSACSQIGIEKPSAGSENAMPSFNHVGLTDGCMECHEKERPAAVAGVIHGEAKDCGACHSFDRKNPWANLSSFNHIPAPENCVKCHETSRPKKPHVPVGDCVFCHISADWKNQHQYSHLPQPAACSECHASSRPGKPHVESGECAGCHEFPEWQ